MTTASHPPQNSAPTIAPPTRMAALLTVPGRLQAAQVLILVSALLFGLAAWWLYADLRAAVQTVGRDTVPSIVAAQQIRAKLADANANLVNVFLTGAGMDSPSWVIYENDMEEVHDALASAAQHITYRDEERPPILAMMTQLAVYERLVGQAFGRGSGAAREHVIQADRLMRGSILPQAAQLDHAKFNHLSTVYTLHRAQRLPPQVALVVSGLILLVMLLGTQVYLVRRMHRIVNPGLALATVLLLVFVGYAATALPQSEEALRVAKEDAFDSIHALWQARAVGYAANADESLRLFSHGNTAEWDRHAADFRRQVTLLVGDNVPQAIAEAQSGGRFKGHLGDEFANLTFANEREAAQTMMDRLALYLHLEDRIHGLEAQGRYEDALEAYIGNRQGWSDWAFDRFDQALGKTLDINQEAFDASIDKAFSLLDPFLYVLAAVVVSLILATLLGLKPRLDEYRF